MASVNDIMASLRSLPRAARARIWSLLGTELISEAEKRESLAERYGKLAAAVCEIAEIPTIHCASHIRAVVWARYAVAYELRQEGYTLGEIGDCLGLHHSTVIYGINQMATALSEPLIYWWEAEMWMELRKRVEDGL